MLRATVTILTVVLLSSSWYSNTTVSAATHDRDELQRACNDASDPDCTCAMDILWYRDSETPGLLAHGMYPAGGAKNIPNSTFEVQGTTSSFTLLGTEYKPGDTIYMFNKGSMVGEVSPVGSYLSIQMRIDQSGTNHNNLDFYAHGLNSSIRAVCGGRVFIDPDQDCYISRCRVQVRKKGTSDWLTAMDKTLCRTADFSRTVSGRMSVVFYLNTVTVVWEPMDEWEPTDTQVLYNDVFVTGGKPMKIELKYYGGAFHPKARYDIDVIPEHTLVPALVATASQGLYYDEHTGIGATLTVVPRGGDPYKSMCSYGVRWGIVHPDNRIFPQPSAHMHMPLGQETYPGQCLSAYTGAILTQSNVPCFDFGIQSSRFRLWTTSVPESVVLSAVPPSAEPIDFVPPTNPTPECNATGCFGQRSVYHLVAKWMAHIAPIKLRMQLSYPNIQSVPTCESIVCNGNCVEDQADLCVNDQALRDAIYATQTALEEAYTRYADVVQTLVTSDRQHRQTRRRRATNYGNGVSSNGGWAVLPNEHKLFQYVSQHAAQFDALGKEMEDIAHKVNEVVGGYNQATEAVNDLEEAFNKHVAGANANFVKIQNAHKELAVDVQQLREFTTTLADQTELLNGKVAALSASTALGFALANDALERQANATAASIKLLRSSVVSAYAQIRETRKSVNYNRYAMAHMAALQATGVSLLSTTTRLTACADSIHRGAIGGCKLAEPYLLANPSYAAQGNVLGHVYDPVKQTVYIAFVTPQHFAEIELTPFVPPPVEIDGELYWIDVKDALVYTGPIHFGGDAGYQIVRASSCIHRACGKITLHNVFYRCIASLAKGLTEHCKFTTQNDYGVAGQDRYFTNDPFVVPIPLSSIYVTGSQTKLSFKNSSLIVDLGVQLQTQQELQAGLASTLADVQAAANRVESYLGTVTATQFDAAMKDINDFHQLTSSIGGPQSLSEVVNHLATTGQQIATIEQSLSNLQSVTQAPPDLTGLESHLNNLEANTNTGLADVSSNIDAISTDVSALTEEFEALKEGLNSLNISTDALANLTVLEAINVTKFKEIETIDIAAMVSRLNNPLYDFPIVDNVDLLSTIVFVLVGLVFFLLIAVGVLFYFVCKDKCGPRIPVGGYQALQMS